MTNPDEKNKATETSHRLSQEPNPDAQPAGFGTTAAEPERQKLPNQGVAGVPGSGVPHNEESRAKEKAQAEADAKAKAAEKTDAPTRATAVDPSKPAEAKGKTDTIVRK